MSVVSMRGRVTEWILTTILAAGGASPAFATETHWFDIPAEPAAVAIRDFASQANVQILVAGENVRDQRFSAVSGEFSTEQGLRLLLAGSNLVPQYVGNRSIALVVSPGTQESATERSVPSSDSVLPSTPAADQPYQAQADPENAAQAPSVSEDAQNKSAHANERPSLEEVLVTGSRLRQSADNGAQEVHVYTSEQIAASGQTSVNDFLSNLPEVSVASRDGAISGNNGTTVQLHGLPVGTTLVLLNGRRIETSGINNSPPFFDLNNIPLAAVERIEVVPEGSSAVYGSDAIAGVVNIILRRNFDGFDSSLRKGWAADLGQTDASVAAGQNWHAGNLTLVGSIKSAGQLEGFQRALSANEDRTALGGPDDRSTLCSPGNVFFPNNFVLNGQTVPYAAIPKGFTGSPSVSEFAPMAGSLNKCSRDAFNSLIPGTHRQNLFVSGSYYPDASIELFTELMYSHVQELTEFGPPFLFAEPGFIFNTVPASNPFNPFGQTVGVSGTLQGLNTAGQSVATDFYRAVLGARGTLDGSWTWEIAGWDSADTSRITAPGTENFNAIQAALNSADRNAALNPFIDGTAGSPALLQSLVYDGKQRYRGSAASAEGLLRGTLANLPAGPLEVAVGGEYQRDGLFTDIVVPDAFTQAGAAQFQRHRYAAFGESRIPVLPSRSNMDRPIVVASVAGRYDHYSDFGGSLTPQYGIEWRPLRNLLVRGTYGKAFKAPSLIDLHSPQTAFTGAIINDPLRNGQPEVITEVGGGNPHLRPETGSSRSIGALYASADGALRLSITYWRIDEDNSIQTLNSQTIVDFENNFPGDVVRASACAGGAPCPVTLVNATLVNFGHISLAGVDVQASSTIDALYGQFTPSIGLTQTSHYTAALLPGVPGTDRDGMANDDGNWAPRWKSTMGLSWKLNSYTTNLAGRYVSHYKDYEPSINGTTRTIGNFWIFDASTRFGFGERLPTANPLIRGGYITFGANNVFNRGPQYSDFFGGSVGYDPLQADILGRLWFVQVGSRW